MEEKTISETKSFLEIPSPSGIVFASGSHPGAYLYVKLEEDSLSVLSVGVGYAMGYTGSW